MMIIARRIIEIATLILMHANQINANQIANPTKMNVISHDNSPVAILLLNVILHSVALVFAGHLPVATPSLSARNLIAHRFQYAVLLLNAAQMTH